ncbi:PLD nuclease N-terminal domain-containing protein [Aeromicrobium sp. P5_D10]
MGKAVLIALGVVMLIFAIFDLVGTPKSQVKLLPKPVWLLILLFVPFAGPLAWLFWGHIKDIPPKPRNTGWTPPPGPRGPDDDPDYLRGL